MARILILILLVANILLPFIVAVTEMRAKSVRGMPLAEFGDITRGKWVDSRSQLFFTRWKGVRVRNIAVYICIATRNMPFMRGVSYALLSCPDVLYQSSYGELFEVPKTCLSHKCLKRFGRSHLLYAEFVLKTYTAVMSRSIRPPRPASDGKIAVLVEPRKHPLYEYTVKQVMCTLGEDWALQLFVSSENEESVRRSFAIHERGLGENIIITRLSSFGLDSMSKLGNRMQSAFSAHVVLYDSIKSEHIFWFQVDVILREPPRLNWLELAYVGSEWVGCQYPGCDSKTCRRVCSGGNSGLSLRRKSILQKVATQGTLPRDLWGINMTFSDQAAQYFGSDELHDNSMSMWFEDDLQLSYKLSKLGLLPPQNIPPRFAVGEAVPSEGIDVARPAGLHKPWCTPWISPEVIMNLLQLPFENFISPEPEG